MIKLYEVHGMTVDERLIGQYLQDKEIAEDFAIYYDLFNKYKADYRVEAILAGSAPEEIRLRAENAPFDERLSLIGLLLDSVSREVRAVMETEDMITELLGLLKEVKTGKTLAEQIEAVKARMEREERCGTLGIDRRTRYERILTFLRSRRRENAEFPAVKAAFDGEVAAMRAAAATAGEHMEQMFRFAESAWQEGQELLILVTELTVSHYAARFIARYGCEAYYRHNESLLFYQRRTEIIRQIGQLETDV